MSNPEKAPAKKTPRPRASYRGARRNALKRGEKLQPHRWQARPEYYNMAHSRLGTPVLADGTLDYSFKGLIRANEKRRH